MYGLVVAEEAIGDFHDWPLVWTRNEGPGWTAPQKSILGPKPAAFTAPSDIVATTLVERYREGQHEAVWSDLTRLGPAVRQKAYLEAALAVCREMAVRSRQNLTTLFQRLHQLDYEFWFMATRELTKLSSEVASEPWREPSIWNPPKHDAPSKLARLEKRGIVVPLAARVWAEEIGEVSFLGAHPALCPFYTSRQHPEIHADPFMTSPILPLLVDSLEDIEEPVIISFTDKDKSELFFDDQFDDEYALTYPDFAIDGKLNGPWYDTTFVGYIRKNFQWGGFPGWERYAARPEKEIAFLREGLLKI